MTQTSGKEDEQDETWTLSNPDHHPSQHHIMDTHNVRSVLQGHSCPQQEGDLTASFQQYQSELGRVTVLLCLTLAAAAGRQGPVFMVLESELPGSRGGSK